MFLTIIPLIVALLGIKIALSAIIFDTQYVFRVPLLVLHVFESVILVAILSVFLTGMVWMSNTLARIELTLHNQPIDVSTTTSDDASTN